jgi:hypothetical protein
MGHGLPPGPVTGLEGPAAIDEGTLARTLSPTPGSVDVEAEEGAARRARAARLASSIVSYARRRRGLRSGDGVCATLVDRALRTAEAKSVADYTTGTLLPDGDYVWGTLITRSELQPGDVVQFRKYRYERVVVTADRIERHAEERPHHTAIVDHVGEDGAVTVFEQNSPEGSPIVRRELYFADSRATSGGRTTTVTVEGTVWFYRPQPR